MNTLSNQYNAELKEVLKIIKHRLAMKKWRIKNPNYMKQWRKENPEKVEGYKNTFLSKCKGNPIYLQHQKEYRQANPEKVKKWSKTYHVSHKEQISEYQTRRYHETSTYYHCGCGSVIKHMEVASIAKYKITRHEGSNKHKKWVTSTP